MNVPARWEQLGPGWFQCFAAPVVEQLGLLLVVAAIGVAGLLQTVPI